MSSWIDKIFLIRTHTTILQPASTITYDLFIRNYKRKVFSAQYFYRVLFSHKAFRGDKGHALRVNHPCGWQMTWEDRLDVMIHTTEWQRGTDMPTARACAALPGLMPSHTYIRQIQSIEQSSWPQWQKTRAIALIRVQREIDEDARLLTPKETEIREKTAAALVERLCDSVEKQEMAGYCH